VTQQQTFLTTIEEAEDFYKQNMKILNKFTR